MLSCALLHAQVKGNIPQSGLRPLRRIAESILKRHAEFNEKMLAITSSMGAHFVWNF
jgi:hypothetical protein